MCIRDRYAFVRNATEGSTGEWQTVTVPTLSADDPTAGDDSVTIRTRIGTTDHGVVTFTGDSTVNISRVGNTINFRGHSVSPPTHDPYTITITSTPADGATISGRRIDITPGEAVQVEFDVAADNPDPDMRMWQIQEINTVGIDGASGATVVNGSDASMGIYRADLEVPASGTTPGTYTMHFTVVYDELGVNDEGEEIFVQRFTREEQYTVVIEESFYLGLLANAPTALTSFATGDNRGALSVGREFTLMNPNPVGGDDLTIYLAIPEDLYDANTFELRTGSYFIRVRQVNDVDVPGFQILSAGTVEAGRNLTLEIGRI